MSSDRIFMTSMELKKQIAFGIVALLISLVPASYVVYEMSHNLVEVKLVLSEPAWMQLYPDYGNGFVKNGYRSKKVDAGKDPVIVSFDLLRPVRALNLNVTDADVATKIFHVAVANAWTGNRLSLPIPTDDMPADGTGSSSIRQADNNGISYRFFFKTPLSLSPPLTYQLKVISASALAAFLIVFLLLNVAMFLIRSLQSRGVLPLRILPDKRAGHAIAAIIFLAVLFGRGWFIVNYGPSIPYWDQWHAEIDKLYIPHMNQDLSFLDLFQPQNEHRGIVSKTIVLALFNLAGEYRADLQMALCAVFFAALASWFYAVCASTVTRNYKAASALCIATLFVLPFGWENTLGGLTGQQALLGLSIGTMWLMTHYPPYTPRWFLGSLCGVGALLEMGSGFLVCAAISAGIAMRIWHERAPTEVRRQLPTLVYSGIIICLGAMLIPEVRGHEGLAAKTLGEFMTMLAKNCAWPGFFVPWWSIFQWLPFLILVAVYLTRRPNKFEDAGFVPFVVGAGLWVLAQSAAVAYARGGGYPDPASRYMDMLAIGVLVNAVAVFALNGSTELSRLPSMGTKALGIVWSAGTVAGLSLLTIINVDFMLPNKKMNNLAQVENVKLFISTGNEQSLKNKPYLDVPYPIPDQLMAILQKAETRKVLPYLFNDASKLP